LLQLNPEASSEAGEFVTTPETLCLVLSMFDGNTDQQVSADDTVKGDWKPVRVGLI
jgi:hypothetical protein